MHQYSYSIPAALAGDAAWREAAPKAKLRRIEFSCPMNVSLEEAAKHIPEMAEMADRIEVASIHIPFGKKICDLTLEDAAERRECLNYTAAFIRACAPLKAPNFTLHADGERNPADRRLAIRNLRDGITQLLPLLQEQHASLNIELLPRKCIGNSPEELAEIIEGFPAENVGLCIDVNHLNHHPEAIPQIIRQLTDRIRSFHLSDYDGPDECHWLPPQGSLDWQAVMAEIRAIRHRVLLIFECWSALQKPAWQQERPIAAARIRAFEKTAAILEAADRINWDNPSF